MTFWVTLVFVLVVLGAVAYAFTRNGTVDEPTFGKDDPMRIFQ